MSVAYSPHAGGRSSGDQVVYRSVSTGLLALGPPGKPGAGMVPADIDPAAAAAADAVEQGAAAGGVVRPLLAATKYKYSRLNLTTNQHGEYDASPGVEVVKAHRPISMFWQEKLGIVLFYLQCHALIWLQCYDFYPKNWRDYWRWTLFTILDFANFIKDEGGANDASDFAIHTLFMVGIPVVSIILYELISRIVYRDRIAGSTYEDRHWVSYLTFQKWALFWAEALYIPMILPWFRMWTCDNNDRIMYIYKDWTCWTTNHYAIIIVLSVVILPLMFTLPYLIWRRCKPIIVFHDGATHERYLQSRELEYIMGCNNLYEYTHVFYIASYKRFWATGRVVQLVQKLLLCCFLLALSQYNAGLTDAVLLTQSVLFLCIIMIPICFNIFFRTYRCQSSNFLKAVLDSVLFFTTVMNVTEANASGFSSSLIDQYTFSYMMLVVNLVGFGFALMLILRWAILERRSKHGGRDIYWPVRETDLVSLHAAHPEMIACLNAGKRLLEESVDTPEEFFPRQNLLDAVENMRTLLAEAKARREGRARRSLLDDRAQSRRPTHRQMTREEEAELIAILKLGEEKSRALEWTLQDMVEDLALLYNTITARVKLSADIGDAPVGGGGGGSLDRELARFDRIQDAFEGFASNLRDKSKDRALMHPFKRDYLAKMLVMKAMVTVGNENFVYGERPPWSAPQRLPPLPLAEEEEVAARILAEQDEAEAAAAEASLLVASSRSGSRRGSASVAHSALGSRVASFMPPSFDPLPASTPLSPPPPNDVAINILANRATRSDADRIGSIERRVRDAAAASDEDDEDEDEKLL